LGCIACTVNGVRREAEVEVRVLIDYFLRESLGAHQHCYQGEY
jgi:aerobic-type carbon monoxide dehydrogenase small subunit (CoxS/CutS family)